MGGKAEELIIKVDGDIKDYKKSIGEVGKTNKKLSKGLELLAKGSAIAFAGLAGSIVFAVNEAKKIETITTQFEILTGSAAKASEIVKDLQEFSASTPFQFEGISKTATQLLGFGFVADEIPDKLQAIGDVASAAGKPIQEVGFIFGQISAAGKLTGERLLQLQERAIPIGPAIAKTMGVAETAVKDLVSKGKVDFATFEKAFQSLSAEGGFAFGGMIKQSKTLDGVLSTVGDNISLLAADIGKELLPTVKLGAEAFLEFVQGMREADSFIGTAVKFWGKAIGESLGTGAERSRESLAKVNEALEEVDQGIARVEKSIEAGKDSTLYNSFLGKAEQDMAEYGELLARKTELEIEQKATSKELDEKELEEKKIKNAELTAADREAAEISLQAKLDARSEEEVARDELEVEIREREAQKTLEHEEALKKLKTDRIKNVSEAKRAVALEDAKKEQKENNLQMKEEVRHGKALSKARAFFRSEEVKGTALLLDNLATLGASGNKTLGRIAKVAAISRAIMNTAEATTNALAKVPYPLNIAAAASTVLAGGVQIATIQQQKFRHGGVFKGGVPGVDSINAVVQQNEIIAPTESFDEVIGSVRAKREAEALTGTEEGGALGGGGQIGIHVTYDSPEASQLITVSQVEDTALGISRDSFKEAS